MSILSRPFLQHLCASFVFCGATLAHAQAIVTIDGGDTFQTIHGWGGNTYSWILNKWNGWADDRVYTVAFKESGVTHVRMATEFDSWERENDDDDPHHFNWEYFAARFHQHDVPALLVQSDFAMMNKIANLPDKRLMIGIWNLPDWMVSDPAKKNHRRLARSRYPEFAESVAAYLLWARDRHNIEISEIVLANEPDGTFMEYSPEELRDLIKIVGAKFKREGLTTKIVAPDLASPHFDPEVWVPALLNDSVAVSFLSAISYHTYYVEGGPDQWNTAFASIARLAAARGLPVYYTEVGTTPWHIPNTTWPWAFECAQMWHNILTHGNASLGFQWALLGRDYAVNPDASRNPIFYAVGQFSWHIPAGAVRIAAESDHHDLLVSAFHHQEENSAQIVFINRLATALQVSVNVHNLNLSTLQSYRTSAGENHVRGSEYRIASHKLKFGAPAFSIMTLTGTILTEKNKSLLAPAIGKQIKGK